MSYYGDGTKKQAIYDGIFFAEDQYEDDEQGRKEFAADLVEVCAAVVSELLDVDRWQR